MKSLNNVQLIGHVGCDPEFKESGGALISKFSLATEDEWTDKETNERQKNTEWHRIVCFKKLAEISKELLKKGSRVYIVGKIKTSKWQDKENENRYSTEIIAEKIIMLDSKKSVEQQES